MAGSGPLGPRLCWHALTAARVRVQGHLAEYCLGTRGGLSGPLMLTHRYPAGCSCTCGRRSRRTVVMRHTQRLPLLLHACCSCAQEGSWDEVSGEAFLRRLLSMPVEEARVHSSVCGAYRGGGESWGGRPLGIQPRGIGVYLLLLHALFGLQPWDRCPPHPADAAKMPPSDAAALQACLLAAFVLAPCMVQGRESMFDLTSTCDVDPRNIAQRIMEIRTQLAAEFVQDLSDVSEENSILLRCAPEQRRCLCRMWELEGGSVHKLSGLSVGLLDAAGPAGVKLRPLVSILEPGHRLIGRMCAALCSSALMVCPHPVQRTRVPLLFDSQ
jgi:hypothetical protein